MFLLSC